MVVPIGSPQIQQKITEPTLVDQIIGFLPFVIIGVLAIVGIILFIRWIFDKQEQRKDIFLRDKLKTIEQCKLLKNEKYINPIWGIPKFLASKGVSIYVEYPPMLHSKQYYKKFDKEYALTLNAGERYLLGSYAGHCVTQDGCYNFLVKSAREKIFFIFPKTFILKVRLPHFQKIVDPQDPSMKKTKKVEVPPDMMTTSTNIITINAVGLEKIGEYYYVVNMDSNGNIVDNKFYAYNDQIDIAVQVQVAEFGRGMASLIDEAVGANPWIQMLRKTDTGLTSE